MRRALMALTLTSLLALAACGGGDPAKAGTSTTTPAGDAAGTFPVELPSGEGTVTVAARPTRIVSLSPTATEMLFAVGAGAQVVAVDDQSNFPAGAPRTELSGFTPNVEAVAGYKPDLVAASNDTDGLVAALAGLHIPTLLLPAARTLDDTYTQIERVGAATGRVGDAAALAVSIRSDIAALVKKLPKRPQALTYYHELDDTYYTATSSTFIGNVYELAGLENIADAADDGSGYPQLSAEKVVAADPDLIFLADTKCGKQSGETVAARPGWNQISAVKAGRVVALDDDVASRWGPRVVDLLRQVVDAVRSVPTARAVGATTTGGG